MAQKIQVKLTKTAKYSYTKNLNAGVLEYTVFALKIDKKNVTNLRDPKN